MHSQLKNKLTSYLYGRASWDIADVDGIRKQDDLWIIKYENSVGQLLDWSVDQKTFTKIMDTDHYTRKMKTKPKYDKQCAMTLVRQVDHIMDMDNIYINVADVSAVDITSSFKKYRFIIDSTRKILIPKYYKSSEIKRM